MNEYIIYKTTNNITGQYYIGRHHIIKKKMYLGSGRKILEAIKEYGKENFTREILYIFENFDDCRDKEKALVTEELVKLTECYNMIPGGGGQQGIGYSKTLSNSELSELAFNYMVIKDENDKFHNEYGPAIINENGTREWYRNGNRHRENDLPEIEYFEGSKEWYKYNLLHRENKRAFIYKSGYEESWVNGKLT